jgi:hypothetical protein
VVDVQSLPAGTKRVEEEGFMKTKGFYSATFLIIFALILASCGGGGGGSTPTSTQTTSAGPIDNAITQIDNASTSDRMAQISGSPAVQLFQVETAFPEAVTLIGEGTASTPFMVPKFAGTPPFIQDPQLVIYAKVLADIKDRSAVKALTDFLDVNLTGDLLWSIDAATHALKILTGQTDVHNVLPFYTADEVIDTINRARTWLAANPGIPQLRGVRLQQPERALSTPTTPQASGEVQIKLVNDGGGQILTLDPNTHTMVPLTFLLKMYRSPGVPPNFQGSTNDQSIIDGGGTILVTAPNSEGDRTKTGKFAICGGYALREALKLGGVNKNIPWNGWSIDPQLVFRALAGAGLLDGPLSIGAAKEGDFVFWTTDNVTTGDNWMTKVIHHAAIVDNVFLYAQPPIIIVRNKDNLSSVFTASIDAQQYNPPKYDNVGNFQYTYGTPYIFRFTNNVTPIMLVDTSMSGKYDNMATSPWLQNVRVTVAGTIPDGTQSILITATGDGILGSKPFKKGYDKLAIGGNIQLILPLGSKTITAQATPDTPSLAEIGPSKVLASAFTTKTLTDGTNGTTDNFFTPANVTLNLGFTGTVTTLAGTAGVSGSTDGIGAAARFYYPEGITTDNTNLYVADSNNGTIRKVVIATGTVTTLAGTAGVTGSANGTGAAAEFTSPEDITTDGANLYVADTWNNTIRKVVITTRAVTTLAGTAGVFGSTDGTGAAAWFNRPRGITTDGTNLYVADTFNHTIRKVVIATGAVTTFAGTAGLTGSTDGMGAAARFYFPVGITTDGTNLYVADMENNTIRVVQ